MRYLRQNTATRVTVGPFIAVANGTTPLTAITATSEHLNLMVDDAGVPTLVLDAAATASGGNNDLVFVTGSNAGYCDLELTAAQTNYVGRACLSINFVTDHLPVFHEFMIMPANVYDSMFGTSVLSVNATQLAGQTITAAAGVTFPTSVASPTNITAATGVVLSGVTHTGAVIPTVTTSVNLTNAASNGDFNSTMKASIATAALTTQITESYRANAAAPTLAQGICEILAHLGEAGISSTTKTVYKFDHSTPAATYTLNSGTTPTLINRSGA